MQRVIFGVLARGGSRRRREGLRDGAPETVAVIVVVSVGLQQLLVSHLLLLLHPQLDNLALEGVDENLDAALSRLLGALVRDYVVQVRRPAFPEAHEPSPGVRLELEVAQVRHDDGVPNDGRLGGFSVVL